MSAARPYLLDGPPLSAGPERLEAHRRRLGPLPPAGPALIPHIESSGLLGRGGAGFPVGRKWRSVAERSAGQAVVLVNGAEGEPKSVKDRALLAARPHLAIDGALLAAGSVGADDIIFYVGEEHRAAATALGAAVAERESELKGRARLIRAPSGYVSGEETAAVHFVESGIALPTTTPPRPFERGIGGRPTLVQNVESLAAAALIARGGSAGVPLLTVSGAVNQPGLVELEPGSTIAHAAAAAGGLRTEAQAVLLGGYFGAWVDVDEAWNLVLDHRSMQAGGLALGCGVVSFLPPDDCGVRATARIIAYLASQSARQCGPCVFGLSAIAMATERLATQTPRPDDLERVTRWSAELPGRGACRHPDGAAGLLQSALLGFADDFAAHQRRRCLATMVKVGVA